MGPKTTPAKQKNTLFSYFPKGSTPNEKNRASGDVLAPKKSPNEKPKSVSERQETAPASKGVWLLICCCLTQRYLTH